MFEVMNHFARHDEVWAVKQSGEIAVELPEIAHPAMFRSGRDFAAWLGLTPESHSSGRKDRLGRISKRGDRYIRHLLYVGAGNVIRFTKKRAAAGENWIRGLQQRRPPKVVIIALANKMARIAWALMVREQPFRSPAQATR